MSLEMNFQEINTRKGEFISRIVYFNTQLYVVLNLTPKKSNKIKRHNQGDREGYHGWDQKLLLSCSRQTAIAVMLFERHLGQEVS